MEELKEEIKQIEDLWKKVYDVCVATPSLYTPHLPNLTVDEVGGVVLTVLQWMKALDTNRKGKNTYVLSKSVMITSLNATITNLKNIASVFERNCWDETPFHSLIGMIIKRFKFGNKNNKE